MYEPKTLAANIRHFRKLSGLTQSELATTLFVTAQNISKWELGQSTPDVSNLCRLAEVFGITVDRLLGTDLTSDGGERMIAIDGGGTKTELVLFRDDGEVLDRAVTGGSNPNAYGVDGAVGELRRGLEQLGAGELGVTAIYGGIAGCGSPEMGRSMTARLKKLYPSARVNITSDIENVISAAECGGDAIAVIAGTGSSVFAREGGVLHRFGGWGYLYDRAYSGYDLGRDAIRATLSAEEGSGERTTLTGLVEARLGYRPVDALSRLYTLSTSEVAAFAEDVLCAYDGGDRIAEEIIDGAIRGVAHNIRAARRHHPTCTRVIISGGLTSRRDILIPRLARCEVGGRGDGCELIFPTAPQVSGAAVGCIGGVSALTREFAEKFLASYKNMLF